MCRAQPISQGYQVPSTGGRVPTWTIWLQVLVAVNESRSYLWISGVLALPYLSTLLEIKKQQHRNKGAIRDGRLPCIWKRKFFSVSPLVCVWISSACLQDFQLFSTRTIQLPDDAWRRVFDGHHALWYASI